MTHLLFGTNFGSLEQLAADLWVMLYVPPFKISTIFLLFLMLHKYSRLFKLDYLHFVPLDKSTLSRF